jgi:hypothetical protein
MAKLPQLTYLVGDEKTSCPKSAAELAAKSQAEIRYVVAEKSYDTEPQAKLALVEVTEQFVSNYVKPKKCATSGEITVAGSKACCEGSAAALVKTAEEAMAKVQLRYQVGEKACSCPNEAAKLAKDTGDVQLFVVGEEKTACSVTARLNLARAKYKAAVAALVKAGGETQSASQGS